MHRPLSHQGNRLAAPLQLEGRTVCKSPTRFGETNGTWDSLLLKTVKSERVLSPQAVVNRWQDYSRAGRTIRPELNNEEYKTKTRRIATSIGGYENPGSFSSFMKKTGTMEDVHSSRKKFFKESQQTEQNAAPRQDRRLLKPHTRKQDDLCSQISTLNSPTFKSKERVDSDWSPVTVKRNNWTSDKKQDFLKSAIGSLPADKQTLRSFRDVDEIKNMQSAQSPRVARHMESTYQDEPLFRSASKRDMNRQSESTYEDSSRLHPYSRGKKTSYSQYTDKDTSNIFVNLYAQRAQTPFTTGSSRYGGMEPLDARFQGRRMQSPQPSTNTINEPKVSRAPAIGQTLYSYRTFASQITF